VVDDAEQEITDVVRGADLLDSTPRQVYLQHLLGLHTPHYVHLPAAVNAAGEKLSKQTLAPPVDARDPVPVLAQVLAFLGQSPPAQLRRATLAEFWDWAVSNWKTERIARRRSLPAG
jgi:glutamyl-Q tRNA(Asp) synthetase